MLAIAAVIVAAPIMGALIGGLRPPPAMVEVLAGIRLWPTLLVWACPRLDTMTQFTWSSFAGPRSPPAQRR
jgi:hypothetical protein